MPAANPWPGGDPVQGGGNPLKSGSFYPGGMGFAKGEEDILGGGESIYGNAPPINLSASSGLGDILKAIQAQAQKQGLSSGQIQGLLSAFKGWAVEG